MNYWFIFAGVFIFISLLIHAIAGDKEYCKLNPRKGNNTNDNMFGFWLMGRGTFQMVSVDLLLTSVFIFLMGINIVPFNLYLSIFIALLYTGYFLFWLLTMFVSKASKKNYLLQGQWLLFLTALALIGFGIIKNTM